MLTFDEFWPKLKAEFSKAPSRKSGVHLLTIPKWSQFRGPMHGEFTLVYRGGDTIWCDTASTDSWRSGVSAAEFRKVYEAWEDYRANRKKRTYIVHELGVQNATWIIPILKSYEHLMVSPANAASGKRR